MANMRNVVFVLEGAHDVSFIGRLLIGRGFAKASTFSAIPDKWKALYPRNFPWNGDLLERVARFPEVYQSPGLAIGLINAGSDSQLVPRLRLAIDALGLDDIDCIGIFADADEAVADERFKSVQKALADLNRDALAEGIPGYPIDVPSEMAGPTQGKPAVGVFVFPDNSAPGSLESILFECAKLAHVDVSQRAREFIFQMDADLAAGHGSMTKLRAGMGKQKAVMGVIANVLKPGSSLAVAIEQRGLVGEAALDLVEVKRISAFIDAVFNRVSA